MSKGRQVQTIKIGLVERKKRPGTYRVAWVHDRMDERCRTRAEFVVVVDVKQFGTGSPIRTPPIWRTT